MALDLRPEIVDPVDVIFIVCKQFRMIDTEMLEFRYIQHVILCYDNQSNPQSDTLRITSCVKVFM